MLYDEKYRSYLEDFVQSQTLFKKCKFGFNRLHVEVRSSVTMVLYYTCSTVVKLLVCVSASTIFRLNYPGKTLLMLETVVVWGGVEVESVKSFKTNHTRQGVSETMNLPYFTLK